MGFEARQAFEKWAAQYDLDLKPEPCSYGEIHRAADGAELAWEAWKAQQDVIETLQSKLILLEAENRALRRRLDEPGSPDS